MAKVMHDRARRRREFLVLLAVSLFLWWTVDASSLPAFPEHPMQDQRGYLENGARCARQFVFQWRSPLYSAWLALFYGVTGQDLGVVFYAEKIASVALVALLTACVGMRLFDWRVGLLSGALAANSKYLLGEQNGSHGLAAALFLASLLALLAKQRSLGVPAAVALLYGATQVRQEAWLPLAIVCGTLALRLLRRRRVLCSRVAILPWAVAIGGCVVVTAVFQVRSVGHEPHRLAEAFGQNLTFTTWEGNQELRLAIADPWLQWEAALSILSPGSDPHDPLQVIAKSPQLVGAHVLRNVRQFPRTLAASVLAPRSLSLLAVLGVIWLYAPGATGEPDRQPGTPWSLVLLWFGAQSSILLLGLALLAWTRYYLPFLPIAWIAMSGLGLGARVGLVSLGRLTASSPVRMNP